MDIEIVGIENIGDEEDEHVFLRVLRACNLGAYAIVDTTFSSDKKVSDEWKHIYRFPVKNLRRNESVVLYTGSGRNRTVKIDGMTFHLYHWGMGEPVWNDTGDCAHLIKIEAESKFCVGDRDE